MLGLPGMPILAEWSGVSPGNFVCGTNFRLTRVVQRRKIHCLEHSCDTLWHSRSIEQAICSAKGEMAVGA